MKENIDKTREIYESLFQEYQALPKETRWKFRFADRVCSQVQTTLYVSERKAKEYIKLVQMAMKFNGESQNT